MIHLSFYPNKDLTIKNDRFSRKLRQKCFFQFKLVRQEVYVRTTIIKIFYIFGFYKDGIVFADIFPQQCTEESGFP